jgi:hypothetical protein
LGSTYGGAERRDEHKRTVRWGGGDVLEDPSGVDVSNERSIVNASVGSDGHHVWLCHHGISPVGIEAHIVANLAAKGSEIPNQVLAPTDQLEETRVLSFSASDLLLNSE